MFQKLGCFFPYSKHVTPRNNNPTVDDRMRLAFTCDLTTVQERRTFDPACVAAQSSPTQFSDRAALHGAGRFITLKHKAGDT